MFSRQHGMTLLELTVVLLVLIALAGVVIPYTADEGGRTACIATDATLANVRDAILGGTAGVGYLSDLGAYPDSPLNDLFTQPAGAFPFNPTTGRGWRGPYVQGGAAADNMLGHLSNRFTDASQSYVATPVASGQSVVPDSFLSPACASGDCRSPILLQVPTGGTLCGQTTAVANPSDYVRLVSAGPDGVLDTALNDAHACARNDDRVLFLRMADPVGNANCS
jgi:type II secretory pathway pseudopilin PulG